MMTILVADDHFTVRLGIEMLIKNLYGNACIIAHAGSGTEVLEKIGATDYDILIQDMNMPEPSGLQLLEQALAIRPTLKILVLSVNPEDFFAPRCFQLGVYGFITKNSSDIELTRAIETIAAGDIYIAESQKKRMLENLAGVEQEFNPLKLLSTRELDLTMLLLKGNGILEAANALSVTTSTASTFKARVFKKLGIKSLLELDQLARRFGLIDDHSIQYKK